MTNCNGKEKIICDACMELRAKATKQCPGCKEVKLYSEYYKKPSGTFGLDHYCKICSRKDKKDRYVPKPKINPFRKLPLERQNDIINELQKTKNIRTICKSLNLKYSTFIRWYREGYCIPQTDNTTIVV